MSGGALGKALLRIGRDTRVRERVTTLALAQRDRQRFVPGADIADALGVAVDLQVLGIGTLYERLGEPATDRAGALAVAEHHLELLTRIRDAEISGELSIEPARLGIDLDEDACLNHLRAIADAAQAQGAFLWLGMGPSATVDRRLDLYQRLRATHTNTGICLGAGLRRTARDVERLLPLAPAVRLVKGGLPEHRSVAFTSSTEIDANFLALAVTLLRECRTRAGMRVALGTHDVELIEQITVHAAAAGIPKDAFEVQVLYGVRAKDQRRLARAGYTVKTLIPYGDDWYAWYLRRIAERPANVLVALRAVLPW